MTLSALLLSARQSLKLAGVAHPDIEAELVLGHVLGLRRAEIYLEPGRAISAEEAARVREMLEARRRRYPLQYLLGEIEFMGLPLLAREGVFIPRPETEILVETVIARAKPGATPIPPGAVVLDLGTGSGAIAVSLARYLEPQLVVATDISPAAVKLARENARLNLVDSCVAVVVADALEAVRGAQLFDLVVSNPPYIATGEIAGLQPEVRDFEPRLALEGGPDGLRFVAGVVAAIPSILKPGGIVAFEIGAAQARAASELFAEAGLVDIEVEQDLAGRDRVIVGYRKP